MVKKPSISLAVGKGVSNTTGRHPAVVMPDLKLPKIRGLELLKYLKNDEKLKTLPVVILTSPMKIGT